MLLAVSAKLTLLTELVHPSKLGLEDGGDALAHVAVGADAVGQAGSGRAAEQVPHSLLQTETL